MVFLQVLLLILSIIMLYYGAEYTLESAEKIGHYFRLSPLVIGLVIIGFGTSLPEFFVSQLACFRGQPDIAVGNIVGSNIANLFLILGVTGVWVPFHLFRNDLKKQLYLHCGIHLVLAFALASSEIPLLAFLLFPFFFIVYLLMTFQEMKKSRHQIEEGEAEAVERIENKIYFLLLLGFVLLYAGGELLVYAGTNLGQLVGVSTFVISAIFVAFGTSFPELVTAMLACYKKKDTDIITGNIVGSNIFNVAFVMGSLAPYHIPVEKSFRFESLALILGAFLLIVLSRFKIHFHRWAGSLFLVVYTAMIAYWVS